jgi:hypothetical protein
MESTLDNNQPVKATGLLNVLTILTFIGCVIQLIGALMGFVGAKANYDNRDQVLAQLKTNEMPDFAKKMIGDPEAYVELITKSYENRVPILLLSLLGAVLCFYGALQMRKLKKQGFMIYVLGQVVPFIATVAFIGIAAIKGWGLISVAIVALFILLYATQRKQLIY